MTTTQTEKLLATTPWFCRACGVCWLCELAEADHTWHLYEMAEPDIRLPGAAPAWTVSGPDPSVCPTCGGTMVMDDRAEQAELN